MKKLKLVLWLYVAIFTFGLISATVFALIPRYGTLPLTDDIDDVHYNSTGSQTVFAGSGNYTDWIDIVKVNITGVDIIVEFQGVGTRSSSNYSFAIAWDVTGSSVQDIVITYSSGAGGYAMQNQISGHPEYGYLWGGSSWLYPAMLFTIPSSDSGVYLTLKTVWNATNELGYNLATMKFRMYVYWTDGSTFAYADFLPEAVGGGGIPGFQLLPLFFSLITLISIITIYRHKRM